MQFDPLGHCSLPAAAFGVPGEGDVVATRAAPSAEVVATAVGIARRYRGKRPSRRDGTIGACKILAFRIRGLRSVVRRTVVVRPGDGKVPSHAAAKTE